jgi:PAS domain S-box-containing protein
MHEPPALPDVEQAAYDTFRHLVEQSPFGVYAVDADFRLVQVSAGAQKVFASVRPLIGRDFAEVLRILWPEPFATEAIGRFRHTLASGEPYHSPSTIERRRDIGDLESYDWKIERVRLPDGRFGVVCHFYDLSERQRYEAELAAALEEQVRARQDAEDAARARDQFLSIASHELRNPIATVYGTAQLLTRTLARESPDPERIARYAKVLERTSAQLSRLTDDLLDASRLQHGTLDMRPERLDLGAFVRELLEREPWRGHEIEPSLPDEAVWVDADPDRIEQVIDNLLDNAVKYSPDGPNITVALRTDAGMASLTVRDEGIGLEPGMAERLFTPFGRADGARQIPGLGLGLYLSRQIVSQHGGSLVADSDGPERGTQLTLRLPVSDTRERPIDADA